ncbi:pro-neuregulin-1, membrane-bound isoform isoform X15 [Denticeps clupeoides]|uniref:pro-neuregulin-1, membrane-bound isoform isoform X15 n=1 Tax=Denticeps clupeoides TaxID=299321 RepID=UPI0010A49013|nr:pro-neuregulin-1, membrane-bound isoform isoform X15 [Denticeps clupeoides]
MTEGVQESSAGLTAPTGSADVPRVPPEETPETDEEEATVANGADVADGDADGNRDCGPLGLAALAGACCVCVEVEQVRSCLHSEKICILPILACLLSLALCTAGLKWVFVDKIFEYEPPTHLDPKRIGQDPIILADPTLGLPKQTSHPNALYPMTTAAVEPDVFLEGKSTAVPFQPSSPKVTLYTPTSAVTSHNLPQTQPGTPSTLKPGRSRLPTRYPLESNNIPFVELPPATSTTPSLKTSSHVARCSDSEKSYCVNGGECFTLELTPGTTKFLCRCPRGYTGNRCQATVPVRVIKPKQAEELYQKRVLTITGICIALLVVGIMCVVAYCKTKKQRKKLHDRLRQSLRERSAMAGMASGPQIPHPPPESLQLVNQYVSQNAVPAQHVIEKETETSFSTSQCTTSTNQSSMTTHPSSQSWSNGKNESMSSESRSVLVMSSAEGSRQGTPSHRGRLNGTGGTHDLGAYLRNTRDMADSHRNSPYSERYVSAMTTPTRLSPVELLPPGSPLSPPSEVSSAPFSSLAMSVPSMAMSPSGEEERPLLFASPPQLRDKQRMCHSGASQQCSRNSAHYNHGQDDASLPPSPLHIVEDDEYGSTQEYDAVATVTAGTTASQPPLLQSPSYNNKLPNGQPAGKRTKCNGTAASATTPTTALQGGGEVASESISERSSSEESETEDERVGEDTPFLNLQNPLAIGILELSTAALLPADASRTNPALRLSPQDDLQTRLSSVMANQDPIAV